MVPAGVSPIGLQVIDKRKMKIFLQRARFIFIEYNMRRRYGCQENWTAAGHMIWIFVPSHDNAERMHGWRKHSRDGTNDSVA